MRSENEIMDLILRIASNDERISAVFLTGSRADPNTAKDFLQDYDIIYIVKELETFLNYHNWIDVFGERSILQLPDEMSFGNVGNTSFHYLMLFKDGNRIDLTLFPLDKLTQEFNTAGDMQVLADKDNIFQSRSRTHHQPCLIKPPSQKEFSDCCNEFWWVSISVAKGLWRKEIPYAKEMLEIPVRKMFLKMIEWHTGIQTGFTASFGKCGRNMQRYISPGLYQKILSTYPDGTIQNIWNSLFVMTDLFDGFANDISMKMNINCNKEEARNVSEYLQGIYKMTIDK